MGLCQLGFCLLLTSIVDWIESVSGQSLRMSLPKRFRWDVPRSSVIKHFPYRVKKWTLTKNVINQKKERNENERKDSSTLTSSSTLSRETET